MGNGDTNQLVLISCNDAYLSNETKTNRSARTCIKLDVMAFCKEKKIIRGRKQNKKRNTSSRKRERKNIERKNKIH